MMYQNHIVNLTYKTAYIKTIILLKKLKRSKLILLLMFKNTLHTQAVSKKIFKLSCSW